MIKEIPLSTLNARELLIQFKLMKALGYHSLWDADFQREMRNPLRRQLYYRLMTMDEIQTSMYQVDLLKGIANRISFFSDPELFKKVMDSEEQRMFDNMPEDEKEAFESKHLRVIDRHPKMSEEDLEKVRLLLNN